VVCEGRDGGLGGGRWRETHQKHRIRNPEEVVRRVREALPAVDERRRREGPLHQDRRLHHHHPRRAHQAQAPPRTGDRDNIG